MPVTDITPDAEKLTMSLTAEFTAPVDRLWRAFTDPRQLERFWGPPGWPATFETFDVECDCRLVAAPITSRGPIIQPTRHPVIAYVFATPLRITHRSASSGTRPGIDENT